MATTLDMSEQLLSRAQVKQRLGVSARTVDRLQERGLLPFVKFPQGRRKLFRAASVDQFIRQSEKRRDVGPEIDRAA
jgi:excisionase family DNA binding protein